jgi:hypothetical protein
MKNGYIGGQFRCPTEARGTPNPAWQSSYPGHETPGESEAAEDRDFFIARAEEKWVSESGRHGKNPPNIRENDTEKVTSFSD